MSHYKNLLTHKKTMPFRQFYIRLKSIVSLLRSHNCILLNLTIYIYIYIQPQGFQRFLSFVCAPYFLFIIPHKLVIRLIFSVHQLLNLVFYKFAHWLIPFLSSFWHFFFFLPPHRSFFPFLYSVLLFRLSSPFFIPFFFCICYV